MVSWVLAPENNLKRRSYPLHCKQCHSTNIVKNGRTRAGQQQYHCRDCGVYTVTDDHAPERATRMEQVEQLHREQVSLRGIARITGVSRPTIRRWLQKKPSEQ
jgi:transposase-like protein